MLGISFECVIENFEQLTTNGDAIGEISCEVLDNEDSNYHKIKDEFADRIAAGVAIKLYNNRKVINLENDNADLGTVIYDIAESLAWRYIQDVCYRFGRYLECYERKIN